MLWIIEPDSSCSFVSRGWSDFTGQSQEEAVGFGWLDSVHPEDREEAKHAILEAIGKREAFEMAIMAAPGRRRIPLGLEFRAAAFR